jgi:hypothetical protein
MNDDVTRKTDPVPVAIEAPVAALGIQAEIVVNENRKLTFQTHVSHHAPRREINDLIDKLNAIGDRQKDAYELTKVEAQHLDTQKKVEAMKGLLVDAQNRAQQEWERVNPGRPFRMTSAQKAQAKNAQTSIKGGEDALEWERTRIALLRKRISEDLY